jgi:hypothetical protein
MEESAIFWMVVSAIITLIYVPIIYKQNQYNNKLIEENEELKSEVQSLQKQLEESTEIINDLKKIEQKYNFIRSNTRKFNIGDKVGVYTIENVDVKIPGIVDHLIGVGQIFINWLTGTKMKPETDPHFVYECSDGNPINTRFTENYLVKMAKESKKAPKKAKTKTN